MAEFFAPRPEVTPTIYAYELVDVASHKGYLKIGYTERDVETRVAEQMHTSAVPYKIVLRASVNLKPCKLAGVVSEGMLLCAEDPDGNLSLLTTEKDFPGGCFIS